MTPAIPVSVDLKDRIDGDIIGIQACAVWNLHIGRGAIKQIGIIRIAEPVFRWSSVVKADIVPVSTAVIEVTAVKIIVSYQPAANVIYRVVHRVLLNDIDGVIFYQDSGIVFCLLAATDRGACVKNNKQKNGGNKK
jgi:hypothetical protein